MREIKVYEFKNLMEQGCGYRHKNGVIPGTNGKEIVDTDDILFLFEEDEKDTEEYELLLEEQTKESNEHLEEMGY